MTGLTTSSASLAEIQLQQLLPSRLRLKPDVRFTPQHDAAERKYVISDAEQQHFFVCNAQTQAFLLSLNEHPTLGDALAALPTAQQTNQPQLAVALQQLLSCGFFIGVPATEQTRPWWAKFKRPVAMKFALFDPSPLLSRLDWLGRLLLNRASLAVFLFLLLYSLLQLVTYWPQLTQHWQSRFFDPLNLLLMPVVYILLKAAHELGHGLAVRYFGGRVKECGVFLIAFMPLPYIDSSASYSFSGRLPRLVVGAAGMLIELLLAMLALYGWTQTSPGIFNDLLFNAAFVGSVTTVLFNLNPLMKFDGYYLLSDLLGILNLDLRSRTLLSQRLKQLIFGLSSQQAATPAFSVDPRLMLYALLAIPYRLFIGLSIALYLSGKFFAFGLALASWLLLQQIIFPAFKGMLSLLQQARAQRQLPRFTLVVAGCGLALYLGLFVISFGSSDSLIAMTETSESQQVRTQVDGAVAEVLVNSGAWVAKGEPVLRLENLGLRIQAHKQALRLEELQAMYQFERQSDLHRAQAIQQQMTAAAEELQSLTQQVEQLMLTAPSSGYWVLPREQDLRGRLVERGKILAHIHVKDADPLRLVTMANAAQAERIRHQLAEISVMFHALPGQEFSAQLVNMVPAANTQLPSRFLGSQMGGEILVDNRDDSGTLAIDSGFKTELLVSETFDSLIPTRAHARFSYHKQPLAAQLSASIKRKLLEEFDW